MGKEPPTYDWLYGADGPPGDPEPTRVLPVRSDRPPSGRSAAPRPEQRRATPPPRPLPPAAADGGRGGRRRPPWRRVVLGVLVLWLAFLLVVPILAWSDITRVEADPGGERPGDQPGTTYLLVGSDSRADLTRRQRRAFGTGDAGGQRTDTIMLLHVGSGPNLLLSVPRDSLVDVPGYGRTKINAAYAFGGAPLLVQTLEQATGIRIDDYVEIGMGGLVGLVNAVGGIEICPEQDMTDPLANLRVKAGCQEANGRTALGYARSRKLSSLGDIDRVRRQREVVSSVGREVASPWSVLNPVRYYRLAHAGTDFLSVGEGTGLLATARFAWAMTRVDGESGLTCVVPIRDLGVNWDPERSDRLFRLIATDRTADISKRLCTPSGLPD